MKFLTTFLVIAFLINRLGWDTIVETLSSARPSWLILALGIFFLSIWLGVIQWRILLSNRGIPLPFSRTFKLYFIGMFFNNFMVGGIVGDIVKVSSIRSRDGKGMAGFAATFLDRFAGLWALCGFAMAGSIVLLRKGALDGTGVTSAVVALFATFMLFAGIMLFLTLKPLQDIFFRITATAPFLKRLPVEQIVSEILIDARDFRLLFNVCTLSLCIQFSRIIVYALTAGSIGLVTMGNIHYFFIFVPVIAMLMTIPLPFGTREAFGGTLFALAGFQLEAAFIMGFLASLVGIAASTLGGVFFITDKLHSPER